MRADRAVLFDFNGTLSDDEPVLTELFREMFAQHLGWQMTTHDYLTRLAGYSDREIIERVVIEQVGDDPKLVEHLMAERRRRYADHVRTQSPIRPDTVAFVRRLAAAEVPMGIVTGAQRADVDLVLANSDLRPHLPVIVCEEDVSHGKPDPEGYLAGAALLDAAPRSVLVLEDSVAGAAAARAAGMTVVGVEGTGSSQALSAVVDAIVPTLHEGLLEVVSQ